MYTATSLLLLLLLLLLLAAAGFQSPWLLCFFNKYNSAFFNNCAVSFAAIAVHVFVDLLLLLLPSVDSDGSSVVPPGSMRIIEAPNILMHNIRCAIS